MSELVVPKEAELAELAKKVNEMMDDKEMQNYAAVVILSQQLYLWAVHYIGKSKYDKTAVEVFMRSIEQALVNEDASPKTFDEFNMREIFMNDVAPFVDAAVDLHYKQSRTEKRLEAAKAVKARSGEIKDSKPAGE